jgi:hypothetical protein
MHNIIKRRSFDLLKVSIANRLQSQQKNEYFIENEYSNLKFIQKQNTYLANITLVNQTSMFYFFAKLFSILC